MEIMVFLIMGNAAFIPSTLLMRWSHTRQVLPGTQGKKFLRHPSRALMHKPSPLALIGVYRRSIDPKP